MQYRWNEPLPKGTTAEELSRYDPRRPRTGSETLAGLVVFVALYLALRGLVPHPPSGIATFGPPGYGCVFTPFSSSTSLLPSAPG